MEKTLTSASPDFTITMTDNQRRIIRSALFDKACETDHYISGYQDVNAAPGPLDTCCTTHMARYKERKAQRDDLLARKAQIVALIDVVDSATSLSTDHVLTSVENVTLLHRDEHGLVQRVTLPDFLELSTTGCPQVEAAVIDLAAAHPGNWANPIARELAAVLDDRDDDASVAATVWLHEHENDTGFWKLIDGLLDHVVSLAEEGTKGRTPGPSTESVRSSSRD
ncbi:hypothetical protein ACIQUM_07610 [Amycolatopsis azurea]|uniref:hypothetical protein n=1 Tax=Amycolatopsis azurea TaxID=36819 RepID=UPI0038277CFE